MASGFSKIFSQCRANIIGMIHVPALPGAPRSSKSVQCILDTVQREAEIYSQCGVNGVLVENMHDIPYLRRQVGPETTAAMTTVCCAVRAIVPSSIPCGVQILAGANRQALAVAMAAQLQFIRAEGFVFSHVADEGWMDADAGELLRYRRAIGAEDVMVFCDVKKKHSSHAVTQDLPVAEMAHAAEFFCADGAILTGSSTGCAASPKDLNAVRGTCPHLPVLIGSGITEKNFAEFANAHAFIVGSYFKENGHWNSPLSGSRVRRLVDAVHAHMNSG